MFGSIFRQQNKEKKGFLGYMGIFESNIAVLEKKYRYLTEKIRELNIEEIEKNVSIERAVNGQKVICRSSGGRRWRLNSRLNPGEAADIYAERYQMRPYGIYFVFGFSDGRHLRSLLQQCDDTNSIVVYEPDLELFCVACHFFDIRDLIEDKRILIYLPEIEIDEDIMLRQILDYSRTKLVEFCVLPGYDILYHDACEKFMESIIARIRDEVVRKSTRLCFNRMIPQHTLFHMKNLIYHRNIEQLKQALSGYDISDIPAVIVSAGPSLDKNIEKLKAAQGKAFIVVVDAAVRTVLKAGIRPDIVCTIDPESPDRFFEGLELTSYYWLCTRLTRPEVVKMYAKNIFYHGFYYAEWNKHLSKELGYTYPDMLSGGCVSAEAFMLTMYLGFRKIILVGQDMAFTNGVSHTKGIEGAFGDNDEYIESRYRIEVKGIDGRMFETDFQMWYYKQWFEKMFRSCEGVVKVINATEGGALIEGAQNRRLEDTIIEECKKELDIYQIESGIAVPFPAEKQKELLCELRKIKQTLAGFMERVDKTIKEQETMMAVAKDAKTSPQTMLQTLREMKAQNDKITKEPILDFVTMYAQKEEYEIGDHIYTEEDMKPYELIGNNIMLLKGYRNGAALLQEDIDEFVMKD